MLNEFYKYIANNVVGFFQGRADAIHPGERYCLRLDTAEMVEGVDRELRNRTALDHIQGVFHYKSVYNTFTIRLSSSLEIIVASKINGMTDDFLATLRNAELTDHHFPILMITYSPIDTITSGTGDLAANGMPFHAASIVNKVKVEIENAELSTADRILLKLELERKQGDRFSDKSSLFEYSDLLTVLGRGYVIDSDFAAFSLLIDDELPSIPDDKIRNRILENHQYFDQIDRVFRHGNISEALEKEYDESFIKHLLDAKKAGTPWYENYTYAMVKSSRDKVKRKLDNPLCINNEDIDAFSESAIEYSFPADTLMFIRNDGETRAKQRKKNILIFNPEQRTSVTVMVHTNIAIRQLWIDSVGATVSITGRELSIDMDANGCVFSRTDIKDINNNITYRIKICVLNLSPNYLENLQTCYFINVIKNATKGSIQAVGLENELVINPRQEEMMSETVRPNETYECNYDQTLILGITDDVMDTDTGTIAIQIKCGAVSIPIQIKDEPVKPTELTGISAFVRKHTERRGMEYRNGKIISGTTEFFTKSPFKDSLILENEIVQKGWMAVNETVNGLEEYKLDVPNAVRNAYSDLLEEMKRQHQLPSLAYLSGKLKLLAEKYVSEVEKALFIIQAGQTLLPQQNDLLLIGAVIQVHDEHTIALSPLHPLNVLYQLMLIKEKQVGDIRDNLVEKLSSLYLLPYLKYSDKTLYCAVEQRHLPEWHIYARASNKRYQGARNFVQKLVTEKINQYIDHFTFLFDDLGNDQFCINLVNMGDCREVLQGLIRYYTRELNAEKTPEALKQFVLNIYCEQGAYNDFSVLSDQKKLREYIQTYGKGVEDVSEIALILSNKIQCYYRSPKEEKYEYAHLTFYEMENSSDDGDSRMDSITTGVSLGGVISGTPSVLNSNWYKTGFGTKHAPGNRLLRMAKQYNALARVAFSSGSSFEPESAIFTSIANSGKGQLGKIYESSNWVVFVDPKVDLSFFKHSEKDGQDLMIIHYSDQYTSASGYDDITVTQKSEQYEEIIQDQLRQKGVSATKTHVHDIISLFNAINGGWMLRLISAKKLAGAVDSNFSREKMSILSAVKLCMAYYSHNSIVWIPISLEEMLRVSGGAGYSPNDGLLSAKSLGFEKGPTSDDILLVGIEGPIDDIKVYLHPVEVKIGQNPAAVISKAHSQVLNTYNGLWKALWPDEDRDALECKLSRNFLVQLVIVSCEKMQLYNVYPNERWDTVVEDYREALLNEQYRFSDALDDMIGKGTIISFKTDALNKSGQVKDEVCTLEMPEKLGSEYMIKSAGEIEEDLDSSRQELPDRIKYLYSSNEMSSSKAQAPLIASVPDESLSSCEDYPSMPVDEEEKPAYDQENCDPSINAITDSVQESVPEKRGPMEERQGMEILFGEDVSNGKELLWLPNDTNKVFHTNTGIIGTMGTGKTQFTKSIITQLYRDQAHNFDGSPLGILIFDYKGDYNESKEDFIAATNAKVLKPYHLPFNPLALTKAKVFKPLLPIHTANAFKDTLSKVYGLGAKQQNTLFSCITQAYSAKGIKAGDPSTWGNIPPTFDMVYNIYLNDEEIKKTDSLAAAMEKLHQFEVFEGDPTKTLSLFDLLKGVVVVDLSGYDSDIQNLIVAITLDLFYSQMQASGSSKMDHQYRQLTKLILVDEADNFMSEEFPALKKILKEGREFGVGTILSTQFLKHFGTSDDYAKYILTWVVHNVADLKQSDVEFVFKTEAKSSETQRLFNDIKGLQKHHSIVKIGTSKPCYIKDKAFWELYQDIIIE